MNRLHALMLLLLPVGLLAALLSCGGGSGSSGAPTAPVVPTAAPPPATAQRYVIDTRDFFLKGGSGSFYNQDKLPVGTLDITMNWDNGDHDMQLFLTDNTCPGAVTLISGGCTILAQATDPPKQKPRRLTWTIKNENTNVSVWVYNPSRQSDEGYLEVGLTSTEKPAPPVDTNPADYKSTLPDGPVAKVFIKVRSIDTGNQNYRDPFQDPQGNWILYNGEFVVFDATQKNSNSQECKWINDPKWTVDDPGFVFVIKGSSQPFLLRADVTKPEGVIAITCNIDGVDSNLLNVKVRQP
jgi:hypothetical protein